LVSNFDVGDEIKKAAAILNPSTNMRTVRASGPQSANCSVPQKLRESGEQLRQEKERMKYVEEGSRKGRDSFSITEPRRSIARAIYWLAEEANSTWLTKIPSMILLYLIPRRSAGFRPSIMTPQNLPGLPVCR